MRPPRSLLLWATVAALGVALVAPAAGQAKSHLPFRFGLNDAVYNHPQGAARIASVYSALGANVQRIDVPWKVVQPKRGVWDWAYMDLAYRAASRHGIRTIGLLSSVPPWASKQDLVGTCIFSPTAANCQRPPAPSHLGDFRHFVAALAARYPRLAAIEVFNEPNMGSFTWQPAADPAYYAKVLRAAHDGAHTVSHGPPVISGGVTPLPYPAPRGSMDPITFLSRMYAAGARGAMDGLGVHPYPGITAPYVPATSGYHRFMAKVRAVRDRAGDHSRHLWITETGYTTAGGPRLAVSPKEQEYWLPDLVTAAFKSRDVDAVVVHTLVDGAGPYGTGFGLRRSDFTPKPVFPRLAAAVRRARALRLGTTSKKCTRKSKSKRCRRARCRKRARKRVRARCHRKHCSRRTLKRRTRKALRHCEKTKRRARRR